MNSVEKIRDTMRSHYTKTFLKHGACVKGVDWAKPEKVQKQFGNILGVIQPEDVNFTILDVGCGYGALLDYLNENISECHRTINYTGIDIVKEMIQKAESSHDKDIPGIVWSFKNIDIFNLFGETKYDYVVCNGILTQKLEISQLEMANYAKSLIRKMHSIANKGFSFNVMSSHVNFTKENLFYFSPVEMLSFCLSEISTKVKILHHDPEYEYTVHCFL